MNTLFTVLLLLTAMPLCAMKKVHFDISHEESTSGKTTLASTSNDASNLSTNTSPNTSPNTILAESRINILTERYNDLRKEIENDESELTRLKQQKPINRYVVLNLNGQINSKREEFVTLKKALILFEEIQKEIPAFTDKISVSLQSYKNNLFDLCEIPNKNQKIRTQILNRHKDIKKAENQIKKILENLLIGKMACALIAMKDDEYEALKMLNLIFNNSVLLKEGINLLEKVYDEIKKLNSETETFQLKHLKSNLESRFNSIVKRLQDIVSGNYDEDYYFLDEYFE